MRRLLVLGGGTAGTMVANRLRRWLKPRDWRVAIVDDDERHFYQPGFLFIPFGVCDPADVVKTKRDLIHDGVEFVVGAVDRVEPDENEVRLTDGRRLPYDYLVISYDERAIPFDLLVTVPLNMGAEFIARSGLGNELNLVPVDRRTLQSKAHANIFAVGDANDIPTSKAGSVAHFSIDVFVDNFLRLARGEPMTEAFDGHANCFVETGDGKAMLIDFNYDTQPLTGRYPLPMIGPLRLLEESHVNHWGKLAFRWIYWNVLLPGRPVPLPSHMSMAGKHQEE